MVHFSIVFYTAQRGELKGHTYSGAQEKVHSEMPCPSSWLGTEELTLCQRPPTQMQKNSAQACP